MASDADRIKETIKRAYEVVRKALGPTPAHKIVWSKRLTSSAGNVRWSNARGSRAAVPTVSLAAKIFSREAKVNGIDKACQEVYDTTVHELCHLYAGCGHNHDETWRALMRKCGLEPTAGQVRHAMATGAQLVDPEVRRQFYIGRRIRFQDGKGAWHDAAVIKHNPSNCRVRELNVDGVLEGEGPQWNLRWSWLATEPASVEVKR